MNYINKIEQLKKRKKVINEKLADYLGISRGGFEKKLNGTSDFYVGELIKIADFFKVPPAYFLDDNYKEQTPDVDKVMAVLTEMIKERI